MIEYSRLRSASGRLDLAEVVPLRFPLALNVETTNVCNFRCVQCPVHFSDYRAIAGPKASLEPKVYDRIIAEAAALGPLKVVRLYGEGEPLLDPTLPVKIQSALDSGAAERVEVTSNASLLTPETAARLVDSGLTYFRVSVYGIDDARHSVITKSPVTPSRILNNVKQLRLIRDERGRRTPYIYAKMIDALGPDNERFLSAYGEVADEAKIEQPMNWSGFDGRDLLGEVYGSQRPADGTLFPFPKRACPYPFYSLVIKANADVVVCCVDWTKNTKVGNLLDQSLEEVWNGEELLRFQRMQLDGNRQQNLACRNCTFLYTAPDSIDGLSSAEWLERRTPRERTHQKGTPCPEESPTR